MEIVSVKIGSPSQATKVNIEAPEQVKVTFKDVVVNNGGGSVKSVNGQTGDVLLDAAAVGALPNTTKIPANTSDLINNSGFITKTVSDLTNYYLKSETYSREKIDNKISAIPKFNIEVVTSLPTTGISDTTVYLVKSGDDSSNLYTEYIYVNGKWEILGSQTIDLSGYALKSEIPTDYAKQTEVSQLSEDIDMLIDSHVLNGEEKTLTVGVDIQVGQVINFKYLAGYGYTIKYRQSGILLPKVQVTGVSGSGYKYHEASMTVDDVESYTFTGVYADLPAGQDLSSYAKKEEVEQLSEEIVNKISKTGITLDRHTDGLIYIFVDGVKVGNGVEVTGEVVEGDIIGNFDEDNNILLSGNIADGTYKLKYQNTNGEWVEYGTLTVKPLVNYTITQNLTKVTSSNSATSVKEGQSFTTNISVASGYKLSSITVTMGGTDITSTAVSGNKVTIASVTGNVVITAVATVPNYTNLFVPSEAKINKRLNSSKAVVDLNGYVIANFIDVSGKTPFTSTTKVYIKGATFTNDANTKIQTFKNETTTDYTTAYSSMNGSAVVVTDEGNGVISISGASSNIASSFADGVKQMVLVLKVSDSAITEADIQNIVITVDEPI